MVPAVIHREKPFTNYEVADTPISGTGTAKTITRKNKIKIARFKAGDGFENLQADQYVLQAEGLRSFRTLVGNDESFARVKGVLKKIGIKPIDPKGITKKSSPGRRQKKFTGRGKSKSTKAVEFAGPLPTDVFTYQAKIAGKIRNLAAKPYSLNFSLPRPVFRSPDNHRVTTEMKISSMTAILGFVNKIGNTVKFVAFGTDEKTSSATANATIKESTWGPKGKGKGKKYKNVKDGHKYVLTAPLSGAGGHSGQVNPAGYPETWHILDYMTIRNEDVMNESYSRGDVGSISNIRGFNIDIMPGFNVQKARMADIFPIITPVSIFRSGVRVIMHTTSFIQYMLSSSVTSRSWHQALGLRWGVMLDMWEQHNHEYLSGSLTIRGMPGVRVGYRIDRKELDLSFYVQSVSHTWEYPGALVTQLTVSRGQSITLGNILKYYEPEPWVNANDQERIALGRIFRSSGVPENKQLGTGALINLKTGIDDLKVTE